MKKTSSRQVSALGIGVVLGTVAWLAFNFIGIASQVASVGKHFPVAPAASSTDRRIVAPSITTIQSEVKESQIEMTPFGPDGSAPGNDREFEQPDYVADFDVASASVRAPLPDNGRLVMDPRMFVFDDNDIELESAFDELMFHPDDEIRQAAIENLLPAMGR
jgi:hypothetical protein